MRRKGRFPRWTTAAALAAAALFVAPAFGVPVTGGAATAPRAVPVGVELASHSIDMAQTIRRFPARVTAIGMPDESGGIYWFEVDIPDLAINEIRAWRITFVSGALFAYVFQVRTNEANRVFVTSLDGPVNGIAVGDGMLIEETPVRRPTPQMRVGQQAPSADA